MSNALSYLHGFYFRCIFTAPCYQVSETHSVSGAGEISVDIGAEAILQIPSEPAADAELSLDLPTETSIQLDSFKLNIPVVDALLSLALQIALGNIKMDPQHVFIAFVLATLASVIRRRLLYFIFIHCDLKLPHIPPWIVAPHIYIYRPPSLSLYPLQWLFLTLSSNIKLCITSGMLIWTINFVGCLPNTGKIIKVRATTNFLLQMLLPVLLTVASIIEAAWFLFEYYLRAAYNYLRTSFVHR